ncbi:carbonic anhydrase [Labilibacter marinus]|uniref:carbonic anhydrase n=1 Tax=Labilibacter marinus TaxID=1477105 RepID=UPI00094FBA29|nr:carbonic anhydrase [Labilibacter marinus]
MDLLDQVFLSNRSWAQGMVKNNKDYFKNLSLTQVPKYLWIGCSDSRVPETEITGSKAGEIFVHRNIANLVHDDDPSLLSVLKYAVDYLKVEHIVVCGHLNCGGVKAAFDGLEDEHLGDWIADIKSSYMSNKDDLSEIVSNTDKINRLAELSVVKQVEKLSSMKVVKDAWGRGQHLHIHGWMFDISTGELNSLKELSPEKRVWAI